MLKEISYADLIIHLTEDVESVLVDVRDPEEFESGHLNGAINIPLQNLSDGLLDYPHSSQLLFICYSGKRSRQAASFAATLGYGNVKSVQGGMAGINHTSS